MHIADASCSESPTSQSADAAAIAKLRDEVTRLKEEQVTIKVEAARNATNSSAELRVAEAEVRPCTHDFPHFVDSSSQASTPKVPKS